MERGQGQWHGGHPSPGTRSQRARGRALAGSSSPKVLVLPRGLASGTPGVGSGTRIWCLHCPTAPGCCQGSSCGHEGSTLRCPSLPHRAGTRWHGHHPGMVTSSSPSAFSAIQPTYGPFSMDTTTVFKGKSGTNSTAAWPTALLVLTQRIYI